MQEIEIDLITWIFIILAGSDYYTLAIGSQLFGDTFYMSRFIQKIMVLNAMMILIWPWKLVGS